MVHVRVYFEWAYLSIPTEFAPMPGHLLAKTSRRVIAVISLGTFDGTCKYVSV